jgi:hypothetical protein
MDNEIFSKYIKEEVENKKPYNSQYNTACNLCDGLIFEGMEFVFFGNKQKMCMDCYMDIQDIAENEAWIY